ncbi:MAG: hypothetical protein IIU35_04620 [Neisseriaceae bacterium]|nr:hypothetical protein [Neisseriaceae bacterium]
MFYLSRFNFSGSLKALSMQEIRQCETISEWRSHLGGLSIKLRIAKMISGCLK